MRNLLFLLSFVSLGLSSCTIISSTNIPGNKIDSFPKTFLGKYELTYPEAFAALAGENTDESSKTYITFKSKSMLIHSPDSDTETQMGDSLYFTSIGKSYYLSLGEEPNITLFKMVKSKKNILMYSLSAEEGTTIDDLSSYFSNIKLLEDEEAIDGGGSTSYSVTIIDDKLEAFFKSKYVMKDPFILKKK